MTERRLLLVTHLYSPDRGGAGAVFADLGEGLVERGWHVTVLCPYPHYPEWRDKSGANGIRITWSKLNGVTVARHGIFIPRSPLSLVQRAGYEFSFLASLLRSLPRVRTVDAIMAFCPTLSAVTFGMIASRLFGVPLWLNVQDVSSGAAAAAGITRGRRLNLLLAQLEARLFNAAHVWSTISPVMQHRLCSLCRHEQPLLFVPNWVDAELARRIAARSGRPHRQPNRPVRLLYAGNIGGKQDLLGLCRRLHLSDADFVLRINGDGAAAGELWRWHADTADSRFVQGPFLPPDDLVAAFDWADFSVISERSGAGGSFFPSKLVVSMMAGLPVFAVSDPDSPLGVEVREAGLGPYFEWTDLDAMIAFIASADQRGARYRDWRTNVLDRAAYYDRDRLIARVDDHLRSMVAADAESLTVSSGARQ